MDILQVENKKKNQMDSNKESLSLSILAALDFIKPVDSQELFKHTYMKLKRALHRLYGK